jgi:hypothetical protein
MSPGCCEVKFRPVWNKTFTLYSSKEKLLALIIELTEGKYWVDNDGFKPCKLTTNGNGTDPRAVLDSHFTLSELMNAPRRHYIVLQAIELIKQYA